MGRAPPGGGPGAGSSRRAWAMVVRPGLKKQALWLPDPALDGHRVVRVPPPTPFTDRADWVHPRGAAVHPRGACRRARARRTLGPCPERAPPHPTAPAARAARRPRVGPASRGAAWDPPRRACRAVHPAAAPPSPGWAQSDHRCRQRDLPSADRAPCARPDTPNQQIGPGYEEISAALEMPIGSIGPTRALARAPAP